MRPPPHAPPPPFPPPAGCSTTLPRPGTRSRRMPPSKPPASASSSRCTVTGRPERRTWTGCGERRGRREPPRHRAAVALVASRVAEPSRPNHVFARWRRGPRSQCPGGGAGVVPRGDRPHREGDGVLQAGAGEPRGVVQQGVWPAAQRWGDGRGWVQGPGCACRASARNRRSAGEACGGRDASSGSGRQLWPRRLVGRRRAGLGHCGGRRVRRQSEASGAHWQRHRAGRRQFQRRFFFRAATGKRNGRPVAAARVGSRCKRGCVAAAQAGGRVCGGRTCGRAPYRPPSPHRDGVASQGRPQVMFVRLASDVPDVMLAF